MGAVVRRAGALGASPFAGFTLRIPRTLPRVPTEDELRQVLPACPDTPTGKRPRAVLLVMADAGLRAGEVCHLLVESWSPRERSLLVRQGKNHKDRMTFVSSTTARAIKEYLATRRVSSEDFLFTTDDGRALTPRLLVHLCHKLSARAGIPVHRRLHPHALRRLAATSWLREGVGLDEVRRLWGHASLNTTLRYSSLVSADLQRAHRRAAAVERMGLNR